MDEEHGGEDGLLAEARPTREAQRQGSVKARLKEHQGRQGRQRRTQDAGSLCGADRKGSRRQQEMKDAQKALEAKVAAKYRQLSEAEIKTLVVDDKWLAALAASVQGELDRVSARR